MHIFSKENVCEDVFCEEDRNHTCGGDGHDDEADPYGKDALGNEGNEDNGNAMEMVVVVVVDTCGWDAYKEDECREEEEEEGAFAFQAVLEAQQNFAWPLLMEDYLSSNMGVDVDTSHLFESFHLLDKVHLHTACKKFGCLHWFESPCLTCLSLYQIEHFAKSWKNRFEKALLKAENPNKSVDFVIEMKRACSLSFGLDFPFHSMGMEFLRANSSWDLKMES